MVPGIYGNEATELRSQQAVCIASIQQLTCGFQDVKARFLMETKKCRLHPRIFRTVQTLAEQRYVGLRVRKSARLPMDYLRGFVIWYSFKECDVLVSQTVATGSTKYVLFRRSHTLVVNFRAVLRYSMYQAYA